MTGSSLAVVLICAGLVGLGVFLVIRELLPSRPALGPALDRLHPQPSSDPVEQLADGSGGGLFDRTIGRYLAGRVGGMLRLPRQEMALLNMSVERFWVLKLAAALLGLLFIPLLWAALAFVGWVLPVSIPAVGSVGLAVLGFVFPDLHVRQAAREARGEFRLNVQAYLELVALERAALHGPVESLERAAEMADGWVFDRIRATLATSRLQARPPWAGLSALADEIGVPELGDVGEIMQASGDEGAQVYETLRSRAQSIRGAYLTDEQSKAKRNTTMLYIPTTLLVLVLFMLGVFPLLMRMLAS